MTSIFYISALVALVATIRVITSFNAVHGALYLVVSLLASAVVFFSLGAPFAGVLEIIIYSGAIMVFFIFVIMLLNLGPQAEMQERLWLGGRAWRGPGLLALVLAGELAYVLLRGPGEPTGPGVTGPKDVAVSLFGPYALGVELASFLLLAGLVGAYHLGRREEREEERR